MELFLYIVVMALVTYLIRMIPFAFFNKKIKSINVSMKITGFLENCQSHVQRTTALTAL